MAGLYRQRPTSQARPGRPLTCRHSQKVRHLDATELIDRRARSRLLPELGRPGGGPRSDARVPAGTARRAREKTGVDESVLTGEGLIRGRRVAVIVSEFRFLGRLHRPRRGGTDRQRRRTRHPRRAAAAGRPGVRRHPHAGRHHRLPVHGEDQRGRPRAPQGRAALPRLPAASHHRRRHGLLGLARPHHRRRTRRPARLSRPPGLRGPLRRARSRRTSRWPRTSSTRARSTRWSRRGSCPTSSTAPWASWSPAPPARSAGRPRTLSVKPSDAGRLGLDRNLPRPAPPGPPPAARATAPGTCFRSTAPARAKRTPACCWRWPASARGPAS